VADTIEAPPLEHPAGPPPPRPRRTLIMATIGVVVAVLLGIVLFVGVGANPSVPTVAPGITSTASYLLRLDVLGPNGAPAPNFTLTDQHGRAVSLSSLRGRSVVLSFNDDKCIDICTLLAEDIVVADRDLGSAAKHVVFLSVNANPYYPGVGAVRSWSDTHGLGRESNWLFVTGSPAALKSVWAKYGVEVELDPTNRTVVHSTELYFIGPNGKQAAVGSFGTATADTQIFAHTMAQMANDVLPSSEQVSVAGPSVLAPNQSSAAIGSKVPAFELPSVTHPDQRIRSSSLRGRYTVLNFWSSTCTACVREMPGLERAAQYLGPRVHFVGVDVLDHRAAAAAFARRAGVTYPLVSDSSGNLASTFQIPVLPFTAIVGPNGFLETLHPGAMTTEQVEYLIQNLDPALMRR
jgi:cytochrome oxidase Cu insertion factor (SCO1/SenC/PrrC family)/thiol-disulfide isomerase/thioredoxin